MEQIKNKKNLILSIILAIVIAIVSFITLPIKVVHASVDYSNVLDDLKGSDNFIESDYPANDNDYSVKLLTIAESDYNELFLYVYQPSALRYSFTCNKVSMSLGFSPNGQNLKPELYDLKLVSNSGVFFKYVVIGFEPPKDDCHYFNIVALYRNSNALLEGSIVGGTTNGKALKVGEQWCCYAENGVMHYEKSTFRTVEMEPVMNGSVDLKEGSKLKEFLGINSGHKILFLAFTVDNFKVKHIYDAELNYQYRYVKYAKTVSSLDFTGQHAIESYTYSEDGDDYNNYDKYYDKSVKLTDKQTYSYQGKGLLSKEYIWNSIYSTTEFLKEYTDQDIVFKNGTSETLKNSQYIFCYADFDYNYGTFYETTQSYPQITYTTTWKSYADFQAVTVLNLHFLDAYEGELNLGVVCDMTTADNVDDAEGDGLKSIEDLLGESFKFTAMLILGLLMVVILWPVISSFIGITIKFVFNGFVIIIKVVWKILTFPFRLLKPKRRE